jgi:hypothetical protein
MDSPCWQSRARRAPRKIRQSPSPRTGKVDFRRQAAEKVGRVSDALDPVSLLSPPQSPQPRPRVGSREPRPMTRLSIAGCVETVMTDDSHLSGSAGRGGRCRPRSAQTAARSALPQGASPDSPKPFHQERRRSSAPPCRGGSPLAWRGSIGPSGRSPSRRWRIDRRRPREVSSGILPHGCCILPLSLPPYSTHRAAGGRSAKPQQPIYQ